MLSNFTYFFTAHQSLPAIAAMIGLACGIITCFALMDNKAPVGAIIGGSLVTAAFAAAIWPLIVAIVGTAAVGYVFITSLHYFIIDPFVDWRTQRAERRAIRARRVLAQMRTMVENKKNLRVVK